MRRLVLAVLFSALFSGGVAGGVLGYQLWRGVHFKYMGHTFSKKDQARFRQGPASQGIVTFVLGIGALYLAIGLVLGAGAGLWLHLLLEGTGRSWNRRRRYLLVGVLVAGLHLLLFALDLQKYPQLYAEHLYEAGGFWRGLQVLLTHSIPRWVYWALLFLPLLFPLALLWRYGKEGGWRWLVAAALVGSLPLLALVILPRWPRWSAGAPTLTATQERPNILVLGVDSLRLDRLSASGYSRPTPHLDRLLKRGVTFSEATTSLPRTFPSLVSLLTGLSPNRHGILHMFPRAAQRDKLFESLARILGRQGYETGVIADVAGDIFSRCNLGFQSISAPRIDVPAVVRMRIFLSSLHLLPYLSGWWGQQLLPTSRSIPQHNDPEILTDRVLRFLGRPRQNPFFLFTFYSVVHFPYAAPYPDYLRYTLPGYKGPYKYHKYQALGRESPTKQEKRQINGLYDGALAAFDRTVGRLLRYLKQTGLDRRTVIVLLSDHGENLFEDGKSLGHGQHLHGSQALRIPLVWVDPTLPSPQQGKRLKPPVRGVDLLPTVLRRLKLRPPRFIEGLDLTPLLWGQKRFANRPVIAETGIWFSPNIEGFHQKRRLYYPGIAHLVTLEKGTGHIVLRRRYEPLVEVAKHRMIRQGPWKLIVAPTHAGVQYFLYHLDKDPLEQKNLAADYPHQVHRLFGLLKFQLEASGSLRESKGYFLPTLRRRNSR